MSKYEKVRDVAREMLNDSDGSSAMGLCVGVIIGAHALEAIGDDDDPDPGQVMKLLEGGAARELIILLDKAREELSSKEFRFGDSSPDDE